MSLYVARHGKTPWNDVFRVCGRTDVPLTEEGYRQAKNLADEAKSVGLDMIICSPLLRARETARVVSEACGVSITIDERLIEQDYGIFEGVSGYDPEFLANKRHFAYKYPGGESMMQVGYRVYSLIEEVKLSHRDKNVLFVCHGGVCRVIKTYFHDMTNDEYYNYLEDNAKLKKYDF